MRDGEAGSLWVCVGRLWARDKTDEENDGSAVSVNEFECEERRKVWELWHVLGVCELTLCNGI